MGNKIIALKRGIRDVGKELNKGTLFSLLIGFVIASFAFYFSMSLDTTINFIVGVILVIVFIFCIWVLIEVFEGYGKTLNEKNNKGKKDKVPVSIKFV